VDGATNAKQARFAASRSSRVLFQVPQRKVAELSRLDATAARPATQSDHILTFGMSARIQSVPADLNAIMDFIKTLRTELSARDLCDPALGATDLNFHDSRFRFGMTSSNLLVCIPAKPDADVTDQISSQAAI